MKLIDRNDYLNKVINVIGTPYIKVITGSAEAANPNCLKHSNVILPIMSKTLILSTSILICQITMN